MLKEYLNSKNTIEDLKKSGRHREWIKTIYFDGYKTKDLHNEMEKYFNDKGYRTYFFRDHSYLVVCF